MAVSWVLVSKRNGDRAVAIYIHLSESTDFETQVYQNIQNTARVSVTEMIDIPIRRQGREVPCGNPYHFP